VLNAVAAAASGGADGWKVAIPLIAAAIALFGVVITLAVSGRRAEHDRLRAMYAGGWAAVQAYKEMAFAIRRRNAEDRAGERVRLSEALRDIQRDLAYHEALIGRVRRGEVGEAYGALVAATRAIAGGIIRRCWDEEPITSDKEMHAPDIAAELEPLKEIEERYLSAMEEAVRGPSVLSAFALSRFRSVFSPNSP
jgi:hypothetical protein